MRNIFEGSFIEEVTGAGKAIFEGGFNFAAYEAMNKFYITASAYRGFQLEFLIWTHLPKFYSVEDVTDLY